MRTQTPLQGVCLVTEPLQPPLKLWTDHIWGNKHFLLVKVKKKKLDQQHLLMMFGTWYSRECEQNLWLIRAEDQIQSHIFTCGSSVMCSNYTLSLAFKLLCCRLELQPGGGAKTPWNWCGVCVWFVQWSCGHTLFFMSWLHRLKHTVTKLHVISYS